MFSGFKNRRQTNLAILSQTLKEIAKDEGLQVEPPRGSSIGKGSRASPSIFDAPTPATKCPFPQAKPKESKREIGIDGNGIIEKQMQKKGPEFINFKALLTS